MTDKVSKKTNVKLTSAIKEMLEKLNAKCVIHRNGDYELRMNDGRIKHFFLTEIDIQKNYNQTNDSFESMKLSIIRKKIRCFLRNQLKKVVLN